MVPVSQPNRRTQTTLRLADLPKTKATHFVFAPDTAEITALIAEHGLLKLENAELRGDITPVGKADWKLSAVLQAKAVQPCVASLKPVRTQIEEPVERLYIAHLEQPSGSEVEMPEDANAEPLPVEVSLRDILSEALALSLPQYPRAQDAELTQRQFTEPGKVPMTDEDARPFAGLAKLKLGGDSDKD